MASHLGITGFDAEMPVLGCLDHHYINDFDTVNY